MISNSVGILPNLCITLAVARFVTIFGSVVYQIRLYSNDEIKIQVDDSFARYIELYCHNALLLLKYYSVEYYLQKLLGGDHNSRSGFVHVTFFFIWIAKRIRFLYTSLSVSVDVAMECLVVYIC